MFMLHLFSTSYKRQVSIKINQSIHQTNKVVVNGESTLNPSTKDFDGHHYAIQYLKIPNQY